MSTLLDTTDAMVWAEEFCRIFQGHMIGMSQVDEGTMVGWFANAMAVAEREAAQKFCPHPMSERIALADDLNSCRACGKLWTQPEEVNWVTL